MFLLSLKNGSSDPTRNSFDKYYMTTVEIKDFDVIIDNKLFFDQAVKSYLKYQEMMTIQQEMYQIICIIRNIISL